MMGGRTPRRVGILGGMGPQATVLLMSRIIDRTPATDDQDHVPLIVDSNSQVPSRVRALIDGDGEDPGPVLASMARGLYAAGAEALAMPCNTAHHYAPLIREAVGIPLLHMIDLTARMVEMRHAGCCRVGVLCSPAVRRTGLFERSFADVGIQTFYPVNEAALLEGIHAVKAQKNETFARKTLSDAAIDLTEQGADILLVACSELSLISNAIANETITIDTMDVLADAIISFATSAAADDKVRPGADQPVFQLSACSDTR